MISATWTIPEVKSVKNLDMEFSIVSSNAVRPCLTRKAGRVNVKGGYKFQVGLACLNRTKLSLIGKNCYHNQHWRVFCEAYNLEEEFAALQSNKFSKEEVYDSGMSPDEAIAGPPSSEELKALLADSERSKLLKKLSEANQQNRFLKRQLQIRDDDLTKFKRELAVVELEIQALVGLAEEISYYGIPNGSRKINGRYIQSHLLSQLQAVHEKLEEQLKDVDAVQSQEVPLFWHGVAESVQVMGSFNGWSQGEDLSPEYNGSYATFSTTLVLRPGRYEIKFLVDGEWQLSPEFPTAGDGLMQNNLLIVA